MTQLYLGQLPADLPVPVGRGQTKRGAANTTVSCNNSTPVGSVFQDGAGSAMTISVNMPYGGYWFVQGQMMSYGNAALWKRGDWGLSLIPFGTVDAAGRGHMRCCAAHFSTIGWQSTCLSHVFECAAGVTYTAGLVFLFAPDANIIQFHQHPYFMVISGRSAFESNL